MDPSSPPIEPPSAKERFLRSTRVEHPFAEHSGLFMAQFRSTSRAKEAFEALREELELATGSRLTQPEAFELVLAFALVNERALLRWADETQRRRAA